MNIKLSEGIIESDNRGMPIMIEGLDDCLQKALISIAAKRGKFAYDRDFGSEMFMVNDLTAERVLSHANEALNRLDMQAISAIIYEDSVQLDVQTIYGTGSINVKLGR